MKEYIIQQDKTRTLMTYKTERELPNGAYIHFLNSHLKNTWTVEQDITDLNSFNLTQTII